MTYCSVCGHKMSPQEEAAYKFWCENCWTDPVHPKYSNQQEKERSTERLKTKKEFTKQ